MMHQCDYCCWYNERYGNCDCPYVMKKSACDKAKKEKGRVDCGANEFLFLAIAALRYDTDDSQWFTDGEDWFL